jgi:renalase
MRRAGCYVEVFEQDRVIGGRIATLRQGPHSFDHGAQYVTARSSAFGSYLDEMTGTGYAARWVPRTNEGGENGVQMLPWIVGTPGMASLVRPLAEGLRIHTGRRAHTISRGDSKTGIAWNIWFDDQTSAGPFNAVAIAVPAPQARLLLGKLEDLAAPLSRVRMMPCWAMMAHFDTAVLPNQDVFSDMSEVIRWIARNNNKPGRTQRGETIVVHASPGFSREAEDVEPDVIAGELWDEVSRALSLSGVQPGHKSAFLWRYGLVDQSLGESFIYSSVHRVGVAGDWCLGRLAEHAYESGQGLGRAIVQSF